MGRLRKQVIAGEIISVRVTKAEMDAMREVMRLTQKNASTVMREALRTCLKNERLRRAAALQADGRKGYIQVEEGYVAAQLHGSGEGMEGKVIGE